MLIVQVELTFDDDAFDEPSCNTLEEVMAKNPMLFMHFANTKRVISIESTKPIEDILQEAGDDRPIE